MPKPNASEEELPAGKDLFDREYVEKLRAEAAGYRTKLKTYTEAFDGLNDEEVDWMLDKVSVIANDPENGAETLFDIVQGFMGEDKMIERLGVEFDDEDGEEDPDGEDDDMSAAEELRAILQERDEAEAAQREEAELEEAREEVYAEIEAAGFERGTPAFMHALAIGKTEAGLGNEVDFTELSPRIAAAAGIEDFVAPVADETPVTDGKPKHPTTPGAGGTGAATEPETDWIAEAKEGGQDLWEAARSRAEARRAS